MKREGREVRRKDESGGEKEVRRDEGRREESRKEGKRRGRKQKRGKESWIFWLQNTTQSLVVH